MCSTTTVFMIQDMIGRGPMYFNAATWLAASWGTGQEEMPMKSLKQEQVRSKDGRAPGDAYIMHPYFAPKRNFVKWFFLGSFVKDGVPDLLAKYTMVPGWELSIFGVDFSEIWVVSSQVVWTLFLFVLTWTPHSIQQIEYIQSMIVFKSFFKIYPIGNVNPNAAFRPSSYIIKSCDLSIKNGWVHLGTPAESQNFV